MLVTRFFFVGPLRDLKHLIGHVSVLSTLMYIYIVCGWDYCSIIIYLYCWSDATKRVGVVHGSGISRYVLSNGETV